jgi:hypothetical protein
MNKIDYNLLTFHNNKQIIGNEYLQQFNASYIKLRIFKQCLLRPILLSTNKIMFII